MTTPPAPERGLARLDWILLVNVALFGLLVGSSQWNPVKAQPGSLTSREFLAYACVFAALTASLWWRLRSFPVSWRLLVACEAGLLLCFAGGIPVRQGTRLYDVRLLAAGDMRFDKVVHFAACILVGLIAGAILRAYGVRLGGVRAAAMIMVVVGVGALWEICEYLVVRTFPDAGVGAYDNNMQDMIANLAGAVAYVLLPERWRAWFEEAPRGPSEGTKGRDGAGRRSGEAAGR